MHVHTHTDTCTHLSVALSMGEDDAGVAVDAAGVGGHSDVVGIPEAHAHRHLGALFRHDVFHAHLRRNGVTRVTVHWV